MTRVLSSSLFAVFLGVLSVQTPAQTPAPLLSPAPLVPCAPAWILWGQLPSLTWVPLSGHERWAACDEERGRSQRGNDKTLYACFPDTFSPRGR